MTRVPVAYVAPSCQACCAKAAPASIANTAGNNERFMTRPLFFDYDAYEFRFFSKLII